MAQPYNHKELEVKWQKVWDDEKAFETSKDYSKPDCGNKKYKRRDCKNYKRG